MNVLETPLYDGDPVPAPSVAVCQSCPAFYARVVGGLVMDKVNAYCRVTGARVSPARVQCNLTEEQKLTCNRAPVTSNL